MADSRGGRRARSRSEAEQVAAPVSLKEAIRQMMEERNLSRDSVHKMIEESIRASYKSKFRTDENCYVEIADDDSEVSVYMIKTIVGDDDLHDSLMEMTLSEARKIGSDAEIGDDVLQELDLKTMERTSVISGKQKFKQSSREFQKNRLYNEFKAKEREIIVGYVQNTDQRSGDCYIDLGNGNSGILPKGLQSPLESYKKDDKIYCYVEEVRVRDRGVDIILSRTSNQLVRKFLELYIPEIADGTIQIYKIVRRAGYKSKVAVFTQSKAIDPVGTCVGMKGSRIQGIVRELHGEKIDIVEYNEIVEQFIANSLTPAVIKMVRVSDYDARRVYAVCDDKELSFAIGKDGLNVQLANKLTDWLIEIKSENQYKELNLDMDSRIEAEELFASNGDSFAGSGSVAKEDAEGDAPRFDSLPAPDGSAVLETERPEMEEDAAPSASLDAADGAGGANGGEGAAGEEIGDEDDIMFSDLPFPETIKDKIASAGIGSVTQFADLGAIDAMDYFGFTAEEYGEFIEVLGKYVELVDES